MILTANQVFLISGAFFASVFAFGLWLGTTGKSRVPKDK